MNTYKKPIIIALAVIIVIAIGVIVAIKMRPIPPFDGKNATFTIDDTPVTFKNGSSIVSAAPGAASMSLTTYFDHETKGDLNGDGREDTAFLVMQNNGGTGIFYYVVVALQTFSGYKTTNAFLIGDRIAPKSIEILPDSKELHVNYVGRKPNDPMTARPSVDSVLVLKVNKEGVLESAAQ